MYVFSFEKLTAWQESIKMIKELYKQTQSFPADERFGLTSQMRRSSVSVASNLAEGTSRQTKKDKSHFTTLSYSSLMELLNQLIIAKELEFIAEKEYLELRKMIEKIANLTNALRKSQVD
ncbi:four helix bundle protein [Leeuwenhoekiella sp. H156]|uniref:four helix bundle protein n=1 Tax=Leeuwenhoekiella sp. H156 TaxID=3450128 RepID=UPI003FA491FE